MNYSTDNTRIIDRKKVPAPYELINNLPIDDDISKLVYGTRQEISQILHDKVGIPASARASLGVYNTKEYLDQLNSSINNCKKIFNL